MDLHGTPCEHVIDQARLVPFPDRLLNLFPIDPDIAGQEGAFEPVGSSRPKVEFYLFSCFLNLAHPLQNSLGMKDGTHQPGFSKECEDNITGLH